MGAGNLRTISSWTGTRFPPLQALGGGGGRSEEGDRAMRECGRALKTSSPDWSGLLALQGDAASLDACTHIDVPGFPIPAFCSRTPWEAVVKAQTLGSLPSMWEAMIVFPSAWLQSSPV